MVVFVGGTAGGGSGGEQMGSIVGRSSKLVGEDEVSGENA